MAAIKIKESWKESQLFKDGKVELVPIDWAWKYWGRDVSPTTNLNDGTLVDLDGLWKNISDVGLKEPLVMRVGLKNEKFRLEAGNHRIQVLHKNGIKMIPMTVQVQDECGPHVENTMTDAKHNFEYTDGLLPKDARGYMKPSEVFRSLHFQG